MQVWVWYRTRLMTVMLSHYYSNQYLTNSHHVDTFEKKKHWNPLFHTHDAVWKEHTVEEWTKQLRSRQEGQLNKFSQARQHLLQKCLWISTRPQCHKSLDIIPHNHICENFKSFCTKPLHNLITKINNIQTKA